MGEDFTGWGNFTRNDNSSLWQEFDWDYFYADNILALSISVALSIVLIFIAIVENGLICWVLLRENRFLKSFANFHLLNLALTDLIFRVLVAPFSVTLESFELTFGSDVLCKASAMGNYTTLAVTFTLLAGISVDRYVHIVFPLKARMLSWKHSRNTVFITWVYAFVCSAPFISSAKYYTIPWTNTKQSTGICIATRGVHLPISTTVFFICAFLAPLMVMAFAYASILRVLSKRAKSKLINRTIAKAKTQAVKMMALVVTAYVFSWGPTLTLTLLQSYAGYFGFYSADAWEVDQLGYSTKIARHLMVSLSLYVLSLTSSVLNPLLFGYYSPNVRQDLKKLCHCRAIHGRTKQYNQQSNHEPRRLNLRHNTIDTPL